MLSRKRVGLAVLLLCFAITGCGGGGAPGSPAPEPAPVSPPLGDALPAVASNIVDLTTVQPGDQVAGLTVESIEPFGPLGPMGATNVRIVFSGEVTVDGEFTYHDADGLDPAQVTFRLADHSRGAVPAIHPDDHPFLSFTNQDFARAQFGPPGSHGQATITIRDYVLERFPSSAALNRAALVDVLELRPSVLPEPKG